MKTYDLKYNDDNVNNEVIKSYFLEGETESSTYFPNFNQINIIVGANNSGKSRFIRFLMSFDNIEGVNNLDLMPNLFSTYNRQVDETNQLIQEKIESLNERIQNIYYAGGINPDKVVMDKFVANKLKRLDNFKDVSSFIEENKKKIKIISYNGVNNDFITNYNKISEDFYKQFNDIKRYYIPTLRTAHSLFNNSETKIENDIFLETLNKYYNLHNIEVEVFTGIHLYKDILNTRNSKREIRKQFENFEKFISKNFFSGRSVDIVAEFDKDKSLRNNNESEIISVHIEGESETRKLYELGDGIQAIIILMYKIFMAEPNSFIFIDEPEINLHPGMQRLFLEQITSNPDLKKKDLRYIISTHSNHFLDLSIEKEDVSIYTFSPKSTLNGEKQFIIKNVNSGDNQLLKSLGVNNSSVFMANCSIWVEGISDRNYIKAFLKSYIDDLNQKNKSKQLNLKEDIDFAFFEYAGSNIDHYFFEEEIEKEDEEIILKDINALALNNRIFLLADSDAVSTTTNKSKFNRLKSLEKAKSENFVPKICWNIREVENLITNEVWEKVLIKFCNEKLVNKYEKEIQDEIEKVLKLIDSKKFRKEYIGNFLNELREKLEKKDKTYILNKSFYETKNDGTFGTIINKRRLSELIFEENISWDIYSQNKDIENLTIEIFDFINK